MVIGYILWSFGILLPNLATLARTVPNRYIRRYVLDSLRMFCVRRCMSWNLIGLCLNAILPMMEKMMSFKIPMSSQIVVVRVGDTDTKLLGHRRHVAGKAKRRDATQCDAMRRNATRCDAMRCDTMRHNATRCDTM
jgi:hypothetical protein